MAKTNFENPKTFWTCLVLFVIGTVSTINIIRFIVFQKSNHKITQIITGKISDFWSCVNLVKSRGLLTVIYYWNSYIYFYERNKLE